MANVTVLRALNIFSIRQRHRIPRHLKHIVMWRKSFALSTRSSYSRRSSPLKVKVYIRGQRRNVPVLRALNIFSIRQRHRIPRHLKHIVMWRKSFALSTLSGYRSSQFGNPRNSKSSVRRGQTAKRYCVKGFKYFFDPSTASDSPSFKAYSYVKEKFPRSPGDRAIDRAL